MALVQSWVVVFFWCAECVYVVIANQFLFQCSVWSWCCLLLFFLYFSKFSFCQYPFTLSLAAKRFIMQKDSESQMIVMARVSDGCYNYHDCLMFSAVSHGTLQTVINPFAEAVPTVSAKAWFIAQCFVIEEWHSHCCHICLIIRGGLTWVNVLLGMCSRTLSIPTY